MNDDQVDRVVDLIGDGPESIRGLRRLSIGLAVGGKLGGEDNDADFQALLAELHRSPGGKIARSSVVTEDLPSSLGRPERFMRLGSIARIEKGRTGIQAAVPGSYPMVVTAEHRLTCDHFDFDGAAAIVPLVSSAGHGKASLQRLHYQEGKFALGTILAAVFPNDTRQLSARFLFEYLSAFKEDLLVSRMIGTANVTLTIGKLSDVPVPLIAASVQARVDQIMGLCDRLEAARACREGVRDRLAAASHARLNVPDPETLQAGARFALDALPALTTRPDQIKALRQTILNLAVRGKLVPQDPNDEPACDLLERIAKDVRGSRDGKAKRHDSLPKINLDQAPFQLPNGWAWGRFPELGTFGRGKSKHRPRNDPALFVGGEHLMIQTGDVARSHGVISTYTSKYNQFGLSQSFKWPMGTLCITIAANIADSGILSFDACFPDSVVGFIPAPVFENVRYFEYFVRTAKADLLQFAPATAQKNINLEILTQVLIPLPPLAEQQRIVAKVDALMGLCDRLEASLTTTAATRRRLLDALLAEALAPLPIAEAA